MRLTVLGGRGAWPDAGQACGGYLVEHDGYRLLVDPGHATVPRLLERIAPDDVDAVFVSHGHPDHCVDLNALLRARVLRTDPAPPLPVYSLPGALDAVLALDRPGLLTDACGRHEFTAGDTLDLGPFRGLTRALPHSVPNAGIRLTAGGHTLAYTGDSGPCPDVVSLARGADLLLAEASYADRVPDGARHHLTGARDAGRQAREAGVAHLMLTHLVPGEESVVAQGMAARAAAAGEFDGRIGVATAGVVVDLG
jgi:ribonuclease BN (tRNA processing enzyme)